MTELEYVRGTIRGTRLVSCLGEQFGDPLLLLLKNHTKRPLTEAKLRFKDQNKTFSMSDN